MKTKLLLLLLAFLSVTIVSAQMTVQQDENTVGFNVDDNTDGDDWDANGNPIYLYLNIPAEQSTNGIGSEPLGPWPGAIMNDIGGNFYKISVDLSSFYQDGVTIWEIFYTYNDNNGNQNPAGNGFSATDVGYVPITTLSTLDVESNDSKFNVINGQLVVSQNESISVNVYNITGQLVKTFTQINLDSNNSLDLNLIENQLYLVRIESQNGIKVIKTVR